VFRTNLTAFKRELQQEIESAAPFLKTQDGGTAHEAHFDLLDLVEFHTEEVDPEDGEVPALELSAVVASVSGSEYIFWDEFCEQSRSRDLIDMILAPKLLITTRPPDPYPFFEERLIYLADWGENQWLALEEIPYDCDASYLHLIAVLEPRENAALVSEFLLHMPSLVTHPACETINYRPDLIPRAVVRKAFEIRLDGKAPSGFGGWDWREMVDCFAYWDENMARHRALVEKLKKSENNNYKLSVTEREQILDWYFENFYREVVPERS
jgi:hypothetical protein